MRPVVTGIAGGSGSGKSTVARQIIEALPGRSVALIDMDGYYRNFAHRPMDERRRINWDHPDTFDIDLLVAHLDQLVRGESIDKPIYDFATHTRSVRTERVRPTDVIVVEGILLLTDARLRTLCDVMVFVDADADVRLARRIRRDALERDRPVEEILEQYLSTVRPMHLQFVEPSKVYADVVLSHSEDGPAAIEGIIANMERHLAGGRA